MRQIEELKPSLNLNKLHQSYIVNQEVSFINFCELTKREALEVLGWRNNPAIRKFMYQKAEITEQEHFDFLRNLPTQENRFYWVVKEKGNILGVIDIVNYNKLESEWGFYLNPNHFGKGLGINLIYHALNFFFKTLEIQRLYGYCQYKNVKGLIFHDLFLINHKGYEKIRTLNSAEWYSKREISGKNWIQQNNDITTLKARKNELKKFNNLAMKKILLDQFILENYDKSRFRVYPKKRQNVHSTA